MKNDHYIAEAETIGFCFSDGCSAQYISWLKETVPKEAFSRPTFSSIVAIIEDLQETERLSWGVVGAKFKSMGLHGSKDDIHYIRTCVQSKTFEEASQCASIVLRNYNVKKKVITLKELAYEGEKAKAEKEQTKWEEEVPAKVSEAFSDVKNSAVHISQVASELIDEEEQILKGFLPYIPSGYDNLDGIISGFGKGDLCFVGARPSMGKTALATNITLNMCTSGAKGLFMSAEMKRTQILKRMVQSFVGMKKEQFQTHSVQLHEILVQLSRLNLIIDDKGGMTDGYIHSVARKQKAIGDLDFIIIDYLQLLASKKVPGESRDERVGNMSRGLKALAKQTDTAVICLAQLNRSLEQRNDKRPMLSDLRESGSIEQDADLVIFLHRPGYYSEVFPKEDLEVIVAKQRSGALGTAHMSFDMPIQRITERKE